MKMTNYNLEYSEIPYDEFHPTIKYRPSTGARKYLNANNLVLLFLFLFISMISFLFLNFLNNFHTLYNKSDFIPLDQTTSSNSSLNQPGAYFDSNSQVYHLARDQYKSIINHNFNKLKETSYYCFKEGTDWNQSLVEGKCVCKANYSLADCGLNDQLLKNQLLRKQSNCHFKQDIVNIKRMNKPSKIIFAMPLYQCGKRSCDKLIDQLVKQYEHIVDLFIFTEIRNSKQSDVEEEDNGLLLKRSNKSLIDERIHLHTSSDKREENHSVKDHGQQQIELSKVMKVNALLEGEKNNEEQVSKQSANQVTSQINQTNQYKNVLYQVKTIDLESNSSKEIVSKVFGSLWKIVFNNVTNYRPNDRIIFVPPFKRINDNFLNFFKFYHGFGEPISIVDNFYARTYTRTRLPKDIQDDLNEMSSAIIFSFQYAMSVCKFKFDNFTQNYCLNNRLLVNRFEENFWKVCKSTVNALYN